jgi:hypothetical protein
MGLSDIAAGLEVVDRQRERGVATVDETDVDLAARMAPVADRLPCAASEAATVVETYASGASVGEAGHEAGLAPLTAAKVLHLGGVDGVSPLAPGARRVVRDWLSADLRRAEARELTGASEAEFVLAAFVERTDPVPEAAEAVAAVQRGRRTGAGERRRALAETVGDGDEYL